SPGIFSGLFLVRFADRAQILRAQQSSVLRPQFQGLDRPTGFAVHQKQAPLALLEQEPFAPLLQGDEDKVQAPALFGERVLLVGAAVRRGAGLKNPVRDELLQPGAQDVLREPEALVKLAEAPFAEKRIADKQ